MCVCVRVSVCAGGSLDVCKRTFVNTYRCICVFVSLKRLYKNNFYEFIACLLYCVMLQKYAKENAK